MENAQLRKDYESNLQVNQQVQGLSNQINDSTTPAQPQTPPQQQTDQNPVTSSQLSSTQTKAPENSIKSKLLFAAKVIIVYFLLSIFSAIITTPLVLAGINNLIMNIVVTVLNIVMFSLSLFLMYKTSKLTSDGKYAHGLFAFYGLTLLQIPGLGRSLTVANLAESAAIVIIGFLAVRILAKK